VPRTVNVRRLGIKSGTIRVATLGSFGKWMVRRDKLARNPVDRLTHPRRKARVPAVPTWGTVKLLLGQCSRRERAILALMAYGGLRRGDVAALDVGDVALTSGFGGSWARVVTRCRRPP
jgi:site-specific recombinase XerC